MKGGDGDVRLQLTHHTSKHDNRRAMVEHQSYNREVTGSTTSQTVLHNDLNPAGPPI